MAFFNFFFSKGLFCQNIDRMKIYLCQDKSFLVIYDAHKYTHKYTALTIKIVYKMLHDI